MKKKISILLTAIGLLCASKVYALPLPEIENNKIIINESGEYVLESDISANIVIQEEINATIDLNGHTLTNINDHTVSNYGTLTIKNGTVDNITGWKAALANFPGATMTIESGTYTRSRETGTGSNTYYVINNLGTMIVNNANVFVGENYGYSALIHNGYYGDSGINDMNIPAGLNNNGKEAELIINDGKFKHGSYTIKNDDYSKLTINDGEFYNSKQTGSIILNYNELEINGGNFLYEGSSALINNNHADDIADKGITKITGGYFKGWVILLTNNGAKVDIENGFFLATHTPSEDIVTDRKFIVYTTGTSGYVNISGGYFNKDVYANGSDANGYNQGNDFLEESYYAVPIGKVPTGQFPPVGEREYTGDDWFWVTDKIELTLTTADKVKVNGTNDPEYPDIELKGIYQANVDGIVIANDDSLENTFGSIYIESRDQGESINIEGYQYHFNDYNSTIYPANTNNYYKNVYVIKEEPGVLKITPFYQDVNLDEMNNKEIETEVIATEGTIVEINWISDLDIDLNLYEISVTDEEGNTIDVNDSYMFMMPNSKTTIKVKQKESNLETESTTTTMEEVTVVVGSTGQNKLSIYYIISFILITTGLIVLKNNAKKKI